MKHQIDCKCMLSTKGLPTLRLRHKHKTQKIKGMWVMTRLAPNSSLTQQSPESQKGRDNPEDQEVHVIKSVETIDKKVRREKV